MTIKIWDINMDSRPVKVLDIHDYLKPALSDLYENDCIFDKFEAVCSGDGTKVLTGSYR
jgi:serine/threonine-protein phosphatase 2A regulatory subunit B